MRNYSDSRQNFKLIQAADSHGFTKRNMGIWSMVLNRLGLPDVFEESVRAIYVSGNWGYTEGGDEITMLRMARNLSSDDVIQLKIYNRLKKNLPRFFEWQDQQPFIIIEREIINDYAFSFKTKARYRFCLWDIIDSLFNLPTSIPQTAIRKAVGDALKDYPTVEKPAKRAKKRKVKSISRAIIQNITDLINVTGSVPLAAVETSSENIITENPSLLIEFIEAILKLKDLEKD